MGVVSDNPAKIVGELKLLPAPTGAPTAIATLTAADLPERVQAWAALDRLVWQDVDASELTPAQLDNLRGWIAGGGRLVIVGGTSGADTLTAFPDDLLPYRPTAVIDADPLALRPILGGVPEGATTLTAYAGDPGEGRALATSGDRVIAAERKLGNGSITLLGFDPTTSWIAEGEDWDTPLWRRLLPARWAGPCRSPTTRRSSPPSRTCRASPCRRRAACWSSCSATSSSWAPSTTSCSSVSTGASGPGSPSRR